MSDVLRANGGRAIVQGEGDLAWDFGLLPSTPAVQAQSQVASLHERFPALAGRWDGKAGVNHHEAVRRVLGKDLPAQQQPTGTCGGRSGSRALEILQCVLIASGKQASFHFVSHAWLYYLARREFHMLGGPDGVAEGSIPPVMAKYGVLSREEAGDLEGAGPHSDDLAGRWGAGRISGEDVLAQEAGRHLVTAMVVCKSAQECADGLASGGVIVQADSQGYRMTRDTEGVCSAQGTWHHYQVRSGVRLTPSGRKVFDYNQSWGENTPDGPLLPGCPGNCFGVEWDVQDRLCRQGVVHCLFGFDLFDLEQGTIPWMF